MDCFVRQDVTNDICEIKQCPIFTSRRSNNLYNKTQVKINTYLLQLSATLIMSGTQTHSPHSSCQGHRHTQSTFILSRTDTHSPHSSCQGQTHTVHIHPVRDTDTHSPHSSCQGHRHTQSTFILSGTQTHTDHIHPVRDTDTQSTFTLHLSYSLHAAESFLRS